MRAHFHIEFRADSKGAVVPTEYVTIRTGRDGQDEVSRRATDMDRSVFADAYAAFTKQGKGSTLEPEERVLKWHGASVIPNLPAGSDSLLLGSQSEGAPAAEGVELPEPEPEEKFGAKHRKKK